MREEVSCNVLSNFGVAAQQCLRIFMQVLVCADPDFCPIFRLSQTRSEMLVLFVYHCCQLLQLPRCSSTMTVSGASAILTASVDLAGTEICCSSCG